MRLITNNAYKNVNENPCSMCMPMGGILPYKGIEGAMVLLHGSQGCSTYMRRHMAEHFNEPIDVGSSSLNEKGTVYGGEKNLKLGLMNLIKVYQPKLIGVLTTCLAETIGEDVERICSEFARENPHISTTLVAGSTPGYGGTHFEGYFATLTSIVKSVVKPVTKPVARLAVDPAIQQIVESADRDRQINLIVPNISPADIRELKRILDSIGVIYTVFPDISETLDRPYEKTYTKIATGGTKLEDIQNMSGAAATIQFGVTVDRAMSPGAYLEEQFGVKLYNLPIPTGIEATDGFLDAVGEITGLEIPKSIINERGRLLDGMIDSHKYNAEGRAVVFGEPEQVLAVTRLCIENGIAPNVIATGSKTDTLASLLEADLRKMNYESRIIQETDFSNVRKHCLEANVNLAIGHSDGRYLTEKAGIPLVRHGFPIHDRVGGQRLLSVGYTGTMMMLDRITNTLLERKLSQYRDTMFETYFAN